MKYSESNIEFQLNEKQVISKSYYFSKMDFDSFLKLNRYFRYFENIKEIYEDLIILKCDNKLSLIEINDKEAKIELKLQIHKQDKESFIKLVRKDYDKDEIFDRLVEEFNSIKVKLSKLEEENNELKEVKEQVKELLKWKSSMEEIKK